MNTPQDAPTLSTTPDQLTFRSAVEVAAAIRRRDLSPVEAVEWTLRAIERLNPMLNAYLSVDSDGALKAARDAEAALVKNSTSIGPLHGVPVSVKDLEMTKGLVSTSGAAAYRSFVPDADSAVVGRLRRSGAIIVGKTNTPAFGLLGETKNRLGNDCRNPWNLGMMTGGSSGGSAAAVAAGITAIATGTDSAGSINCPSGMCGVFGIKPTHGRVPIIPDAGDSLLFNDAGPLARRVADAALVLSVLSGHDARDPVSLREHPPDYLAAAEGSLANVRIAWSPDAGHFAVEPVVVGIAERSAAAFQELGSEPVPASPAVPDPWEIYTPLYITDIHVSLDEFLAEHPEEIYPETVDEIESAPRIQAEDYVRAYHRLLEFRSTMADFFEEYDLLLTPSTAVPAFPVGEPPSTIGGRSVRPGWMSFMPFQIMWNMTGQPAASVPAGFTPDGLPVGMMIIGAHGREDLVLAASAAFERIRPWAEKTPPVSVVTT